MNLIKAKLPYGLNNFGIFFFVFFHVLRATLAPFASGIKKYLSVLLKRAITSLVHQASDLRHIREFDFEEPASAHRVAVGQ